jgi:hypothetical protein
MGRSQYPVQKSRAADAPALSASRRREATAGGVGAGDGMPVSYTAASAEGGAAALGRLRPDNGNWWDEQPGRRPFTSGTRISKLSFISVFGEVLPTESSHDLGGVNFA